MERGSPESKPVAASRGFSTDLATAMIRGSGRARSARRLRRFGPERPSPEAPVSQLPAAAPSREGGLKTAEELGFPTEDGPPAPGVHRIGEPPQSPFLTCSGDVPGTHEPDGPLTLSLGSPDAGSRYRGLPRHCLPAGTPRG